MLSFKDTAVSNKYLFLVFITFHMLTDIKLVLLCIVTTLSLYYSKYNVLNHPIDHLSIGHKQVKGTDKAYLKRISYWIFQKKH